LSPASRYPTYLLDFSVYAGNSGGPVYVVRPGPSRDGPRSAVLVTGLLTQQIKIKENRLAIGNVTQADYIVETLVLINPDGPAEVAPAQGSVSASDPIPAAGGPQPSAMERLKAAWDATLTDIAILARRAWIVVEQAVLDRITPDARRA
jgi:hypothetical protein